MTDNVVRLPDAALRDPAIEEAIASIKAIANQTR